MIIARRVLAVLLGFLLFVSVAVTATTCFASAAVRDENFVPALLEREQVYDYFYDSLLDAALTDVVDKGFDVGEAGKSGSARLTFEDPVETKEALKAFIETVLPREYVETEVEQAFHEVLPYATGRTDSFAIDLEVEDRILAIPDALRAATERASLGKVITESLVASLVQDRLNELQFEGIDLSFTEEEARDLAVRILPPDWLEARLIEAADAMAPYLAGRTDDFEFRLVLSDRVAAIGEVLKQKLDREDLARKLVLDNIVEPLVIEQVGGSRTVAFGIEVTEEDILASIRNITTREWIGQQVSALIDRLLDYLTGKSSTLAITVNLADRKAAAVEEIHDLAERKLREAASGLPKCPDLATAAAALADAARNTLPRCLPGNLDIPGLIRPLLPVLLSDVDKQVVEAIPDTINFTDADFRSTLGADSVEAIDEVRKTISEGYVFNRAKLFGLMSDPKSQDEFEERVQDIRAGGRWTEQDFEARLLDTPEAREAFDSVRRVGGLTTAAIALTTLVVVLLAVAIAFLGGTSWPGRLLWGAGAVLTTSLLFMIAVMVAGSVARSQVAAQLDTAEFVDADFRAEFPNTAAVIESQETKDKILDVISYLSGRLRNSALPWLIVSALGVLIGIAWITQGSPDTWIRRRQETASPAPAASP